MGMVLFGWSLALIGNVTAGKFSEAALAFAADAVYGRCLASGPGTEARDPIRHTRDPYLLGWFRCFGDTGSMTKAC